jgi:hypothetical protein
LKKALEAVKALEALIWRRGEEERRRRGEW